MADTLELVLELADKVSGPAQRAAAALAKIDAQAQKAQASAQKVADKYAAQQSAQMEKIQRGLVKQNEAAVKLAEQTSRKREKALIAEAAATRRLGLAQVAAAKMNKQHDQEHSFGYGLKSALGLTGLGGKVAKGAFWGEIAAEGVSKIAEGFLEGAHKAIEFLTEGVKKAFEEGGKAENLRLSYKLLLGKTGGKEALEDINRFSGKTKYSEDAIAEMMRPLFNAGLRGTGARSAFAASGDLEAAGLGPASDFIEKFAKIQLKGGVTEKLLVGMGVNIKDFKEALAKETNTKDKEAAFKKATEGKSDPQAIMNAIFSGIEKRQGGQLGSGTEAASKTMSARLGKIENLPNEYLKKMSQSPAWDKLSDKLGTLLEGLNPDGERGMKIVDALFRVFDKLAVAVSNAITPENIDKFTVGVAHAIDTLQKLPDILDTIVTVSEILATIWIGAQVVGGVTALAAALPGLAIAAAAVTAPILAIGAAVAGVALAIQQTKAAIDELGGWDKVKDDWNQFDMAKVDKNDDEEALFDLKYGGAGYKLKPAGGGGGKANVQVGEINIHAAPGDDVHDMAESAAAAVEKSMSSIAEGSAQEF